MKRMCCLPRVVLGVCEDGSCELAHNRGTLQASFLFPFLKNKDRICDIVLYFLKTSSRYLSEKLIFYMKLDSSLPSFLSNLISLVSINKTSL